MRVATTLQEFERHVRDPEEVQRSLDRLLQDPVFQDGLSRSHHQALSWREYLLMKVLHWYALVMEWLFDLKDESPILYYLMFAGLLLLLVLLLTHMVMTFARTLRHQEPLVTAPTPEVIRRAQFIERRQQARLLARQGHTKDAVRELVLALLTLLEERRHAVALNWTNREILQRLRLATDAHQALRHFETTVESLSYGGEVPRAEDFDRLDQVLQESVDAVPVDPRGR